VTRAPGRPRGSAARGAQGYRQQPHQREVHQQSAAAGRARQPRATRPAASGGHRDQTAPAGFPGTITGPGPVDAVQRRARPSCSRHDFPTWTVGVSVFVPDRRQASSRANYARTQLERSQSEAAVEGGRKRGRFSRWRDAAWKIEMKRQADRGRTAHRRGELAEAAASTPSASAFEVGMSTSFLTIQAQARFSPTPGTNELGAVAGRTTCRWSTSRRCSWPDPQGIEHGPLRQRQTNDGWRRHDRGRAAAQQARRPAQSSNPLGSIIR